MSIKRSSSKRRDESPPDNPSKTVAGLYIRVSTDYQAEEGYSIDAQKNMLEAYCRSRAITDYSFYIDGGFTGSNIERPELQRLIRDIEHGRIHTVVVYKLDRLSRSQRDTLYLIEDVFNPNKASFVSLQESIDTSTPMGRAIIGILSAFAQLERETIHERTKMGLLERVKLGYWPGGARTPFGYTYNPKTGVLEQNDDARKVLQMRDLLFQGYAPEAISRMMGFKYDTTVRNALKRRTNLGLIPFDGAEYKGLHEPIFSQEDYDKIIGILETRSVAQRSEGYLLSGFMECGVCHAKMRYQKWGKGLKIYCYSQQKSKKYLIRDPDCDNARIDACDVEDVVLSALFSHRIHEEKPEAPGAAQVQSPLSILTDQYDAAERKLKRLYAIYAEGDDAILDVIEEHKKELAQLGRRIELEESFVESRKSAGNEGGVDLINLKNLWPHMSMRERRAAIRECINKITITGHKVDIDFKF